MIKKLLAFSLIVFLIAGIVGAPLLRARREDAAGRALYLALADGERRGDAAALERLLDRGVSPNARLYEYVEGTDAQMLQGEISRSVMTHYMAFEYPVFWAAHRGNLALTRTLIDHGADLSLRNDLGNAVIPDLYCLSLPPDQPNTKDTALPVVALLVAHGADIDEPDITDESALDHAAVDLNPTSLKALFGMGAHATPYTFSLLVNSDCDDCPEPCREAIHALVEGAGGILTDPNDHASYVQEALNQCNRCNRALAAAMLDEGFPPDRRGSDESAIVLAIHGDASLVPSLIEDGADVNAHSHEYGETPLEAAAQTGGIPLAELLIRHGATTDRIDDLFFAASRSDVTSMSHGATRDSTNPGGNLAMALGLPPAAVDHSADEHD